MKSTRDLARRLPQSRQGKTKSNVSAGSNPRSIAPANQTIAKFIADYRPGWSLPGPFYYDAAIYRADLDRIWRKGWLFAGHACEIQNPGDYFLVGVDTDSILIIRGEDGEVRGFHNVCRHRGSLICTESAGQAKKLVCPYHQWTYGLDGKLMACRGMPGDLNKGDFQLKQVAVCEIEGLIYFSLADEPSDPEPAVEAIAPLAQPQGFRQAKVAKSVDYLVKANWKLVWENNRECYHCNVNHPQYIKANFDHYNSDDTTPRIQQQIDAAVQRVQKNRGANGASPTHKRAGMTTFPDAENNIWYSANRTPLIDGYVTESMDGKRVAPLMGECREEFTDTFRMRTLPNFWNHSSCDHGVSTRLLPLGPQLTSVRVWWLVDAEAVEGRDYDLSRLMPFWQLTSEQDWEICDRQQRGINSSAYTPGPYSKYKEYNVDGFVRWYLKSLGAEVA